MSGTILLADDSLTIQKVVELTFADTNYRVVAVSSGDELIERLAATNPNLIICDVIMPGRDGYEVCQQIKSSPDWLHLPVILLTGTFEPFDRDRAIAAGCSEIITKPFEARKLVDTVERLIGIPDHVEMPATDSAQTTRPVDAPASEPAAAELPLPRVEVPMPDTHEDFGTQLSSASNEIEEEGIEFTRSGFDEMEAAGRKTPEAADGESPEGILDYDAEAVQPEDLEPTRPYPDPPPPSVDVSAQTVKIDVSAFAEKPAEAVAEDPPDDGIDGEDAPAAETDAINAETGPALPPEEEQEPAFEAESVTEEPEEDQRESSSPEFEDEPSMADTSPVDPPVEASDDQAILSPGEPGTPLSDEDIDRIARRVIELAGDRLDQIAWEVVPDMAEIVVRQRVRELEAEAEGSPPDSVQ